MSVCAHYVRGMYAHDVNVCGIFMGCMCVTLYGVWMHAYYV